jgi:hypothetical protein
MAASLSPPPPPSMRARGRAPAASSFAVSGRGGPFGETINAGPIDAKVFEALAP